MSYESLRCLALLFIIVVLYCLLEFYFLKVSFPYCMLLTKMAVMVFHLIKYLTCFFHKKDPDLPFLTEYALETLKCELLSSSLQYR